MAKQGEELADKLFPRFEYEDPSDSILSIAPEQRRLHTDTYDLSISTVIDYLEKGHLFIPHFQRGYVWTQVQASRLVESLIIQCPIPVVYLNQETDERLSVIDGNQRIQSLRKYVSNEFELKGLTAYPELEGLYYHQLDSRIQRHIKNRTLRCIVIMKDTHPQVKFDVFERLNTGAVKLTAQELRHGIYHGKLMDFVDRLAKRKNWKKMLALTQDRRMRAEEFVIRLLAFYTNYSDYSKPMSAFLNRFCEKYRDLTDIQEKELEKAFDTVVSRLNDLYAHFAFKIFTDRGEVLSEFNAALFDAEVMSTKSLDGAVINSKLQSRIRSLFPKLFHDETFQKAITRATSDEKQVKARVEKLQKLIADLV
ncbi:MAG: DUF262 domain-containing protein [Verrucomicrobia bacterium]|nr:MAG: DUF262 domain-containing protein [Verrucomicrobiota bacterium]